ncbi:hypothetical protein LCGC14_2825860 [marine sediment metagenome]|uniref:Uncharacterized protein n=1 Tax=marine sediment metagenome TaxID=412755 RepID=A0A0F9B6R0_9ZZZZ
MESRSGYRPLVKWATLTIATLAVVALFWLAAEQHYRGCVEAAQYQGDKAYSGAAHLDRSIAEAVESCSRLPF